MAGLWNAEHTLMQRYGVMRIYGRKAGDDHGRIEKPMLIIWLVAGIAYIGGYVDLQNLARKLGVGGTNTRSLDLLDGLSAYARVVFWVAALCGVVMAVRWCKAERRLGAMASGPKHWYALGTAGLIVAVMIDPIAGVAGYVAAHAIEYFAVVHSSLRKRSDEAPVATVTRTRARRAAAYVGLLRGDRRGGLLHQVAARWSPLCVRGAVLRRAAHPVRRVRVEAAPSRRGCLARHHALDLAGLTRFRRRDGSRRRRSTRARAWRACG